MIIQHNTSLSIAAASFVVSGKDFTGSWLFHTLAAHDVFMHLRFSAFVAVVELVL